MNTTSHLQTRGRRRRHLAPAQPRPWPRSLACREAAACPLADDARAADGDRAALHNLRVVAAVPPRRRGRVDSRRGKQE
jgi:hypothetical protein